MARTTKATLLEEIEAATQERDRMFLALCDKVNHVEPDATAQWLYGDQKWSADLYRSTGATGGYVVITYATGPNSVMVSVRGFEEWASAVRENGLGVGDALTFRQGLEVLEAARHRVLCAAVA